MLVAFHLPDNTLRSTIECMAMNSDPRCLFPFCLRDDHVRGETKSIAFSFCECHHQAEIQRCPTYLASLLARVFGSHAFVPSHSPTAVVHVHTWPIYLLRLHRRVLFNGNAPIPFCGWCWILIERKQQKPNSTKFGTTDWRFQNTFLFVQRTLYMYKPSMSHLSRVLHVAKHLFRENTVRS